MLYNTTVKGNPTTKWLRIYQQFRFPTQLIHVVNPDAFVFS